MEFPVPSAPAPVFPGFDACWLNRPKRRGPVLIEGRTETAVHARKVVCPETPHLGLRRAVEDHAGGLPARERRGFITGAGTDAVGACRERSGRVPDAGVRWRG